MKRAANLLAESPARLEINAGVWLDARRAVWLAEPRVLAVADLHLGYAWAHRHSGQLLPIASGEDTLPRLRALVEEFQPRELVLLGDLVHAAVPVPELTGCLRQLLELVPVGARLRAIAGNHDRHLATRLQEAGLHLPLERSVRVGTNLLLHGDVADPAEAAAHLAAAAEQHGSVIFGHEHPAISISDGIATRVRVPCFLFAENALVVPAFSPWAAGADVRAREFLSALTAAADCRQAVAILAGKLLPLTF